MRVRNLVAVTFATTLCASLGSTGAAGFTASIAITERTEAYVRPGSAKMAPYGAALHQLILSEVKRTQLPFAIASPFTFIIQFQLNRQGQLVDLKLLRQSNLAEANEYAGLIVRRASRNFPAPPADLPGERLGFILPIAMGYRAVSGEFVGPPPIRIIVSPSTPPAPGRKRPAPRTPG